MLINKPSTWVIEHQGRYIGHIRLLDTRHDRQVELEIGIFDPLKLGEGLGCKAIKLVLAHAFGAMQVRSVNLKVAIYNSRAVRCYRKCGFVVDNNRTESARAGKDYLPMKLFRREFVKLQSNG